MAKVNCQTLYEGVWRDDFSMGSRICRAKVEECRGYGTARGYYGRGVKCPRRVHQLADCGLTCALLIRMKAPPGSINGDYGVVSAHCNRSPNTYNKNVPRRRIIDDDD